MNIRAARFLEIGDRVFIRNGIYETEARVQYKESDMPGKLWITVYWTDSQGRQRLARKRPEAVYMERRQS